MPHQCVHCGEIYPDAAKELLEGCKCGSKFFYYVKQERLDELNNINDSEIENTLTELNRADKQQIEKDIREITGLSNEPERPVVLDLESVRVLSPGKFEIDIVNLFNKKRPIIYKLEEGKYILDLSSTFKTSASEINKKIRDPRLLLPKETKEEMTEDLENEEEEDLEENEDKKESKEDNFEEDEDIEDADKESIEEESDYDEEDNEEETKKDN